MRSALPARLELAALVLLLLTALMPRLRDAAAPLDRGFDGQQAGFFTIAAINYERLGVGRTLGYPVLNIDLGERGGPTGIWDRPEHWLAYANHPPSVALLAWASLNVLAPDSWNAAWREGRGPAGFELALRFPFLVLHVLALLALWWCVREGHGPGTGLLALALAAGSAPLVTYAGLVNYENAALPFLLLTVGLHSRFVRLGRRRDLFALAACALAGGAITWAPLFFALALTAVAWISPDRRRGVAAGLVAVLATLVPLVVHTRWSAVALERLGQPPAAATQRAGELLAPLFDGSAPLSSWVALQVARWVEWFAAPALLVAAAGLLLALVALAKAPRGLALRPQLRSPVALSLLLGGLLYCLAFYRHTLDAQTSFLMLLAPGFAALGALAFAALAPHLTPMRAGIAPLVVLVSSVVLIGLGRAQALRFGLRGECGASFVNLPAPEIDMPRETAAGLCEVLEPGEFGLYPAALGLNLAVNLYAWRSLWPVTGLEDPTARAVAERAGLGSAPRWLLWPAHPPTAMNEPGVLDAFGAAQTRAPDRTGAGWSSWNDH